MGTLQFSYSCNPYCVIGMFYMAQKMCVCVRQVSDSLEDADLATKERAGASSKNSKTHPGGVGGKGVSAIK